MKTENRTLKSGTVVTLKTKLGRKDKHELLKIQSRGMNHSDVKEGEIPEVPLENLLDYQYEGISRMIVGLSDEQKDDLSDEDTLELNEIFKLIVEKDQKSQAETKK